MDLVGYKAIEQSGYQSSAQNRGESSMSPTKIVPKKTLGGSKIKVAVRIRPLLEQEESSG